MNREKLIFSLLLALAVVSRASVGEFFEYNSFPLSSGARCLDGSNYGMYYASGYGSGARNIIFSFWGGGWCGYSDDTKFLKDCYDRSLTVLGSSKDWNKDKQTYEDSKFLSGIQEKNPSFYNWHRFDVPYCDGTGHQGHREQPLDYQGNQLYFRGKKNVLTALDFAFSKVGIANIDRFVVTGCSAGGLATYNWTQYIADYLKARNSNIKVFGIPDSGFFIDYVNLKTKDNDYRKRFQMIYRYVNQEVAPISTACLKDNVGQEHMCLFAEKLSLYINVPFLMLQPGYDSWQLVNILGEDCAGYDSISNCPANLQVGIQNYKAAQNSLINTNLSKNPNLAVWDPACLTHCWSLEATFDPNWSVPGSSGITIQKAVESLLRTEGDQTKNRYIDSVNWPENKGCANVKMQQCNSRR